MLGKEKSSKRRRPRAGYWSEANAAAMRRNRCMLERERVCVKDPVKINAG
jgi:hypothetical protein